MQKRLDYQELWDSFSIGERLSLLRQIAGPYVARQDRYATWAGCEKKSWRELPDNLKSELIKLDWEFSLGKNL